MIKLHDNYEDMFKNASKALCNYISRNTNIKALIIGMSGGIDSAITACIMHEAALRHGVYCAGYCLPIITNRPVETNRGLEVGRTMLEECIEVDLSHDFIPLVKAIDSELYENMWYATVGNTPIHKDMRIRLGNLKARMRMMFLYDKARKHNGIVVSTDNLTEYLLGFWTLHGDVGDFGPIQNLYKTEVYGMADWLANQSDRYMMSQLLTPTIKAMPTDGLGVGNGDLDQLLPDWEGSWIGGYKEIDNELIRYQNDSPRSNRKLGTVAHRHIQTKYKRNNPSSPSRGELLEVWA